MHTAVYHISIISDQIEQGNSYNSQSTWTFLVRKNAKPERAGKIPVN